MKYLIAAAAIGLVAGHFLFKADDQTRIMNQCELEALKNFPEDGHRPFTNRAEYIFRCMGAAGYELSVSKECPTTDPVRIFLPSCYVSTSRFAYLIRTLN